MKIGKQLLANAAFMSKQHLQDVAGRELFRRSGVSGSDYRLDALRSDLHLGTGVYTLRVRTDRGAYHRNDSLF